MQLVHRDKQEDNDKYCSQCGAKLSQEYPHEICPLCEEQNLFSEVKEFIRENEVNEQDVATRFNIPVRKVRSWIRDGRIQYKGEDVNAISGVKCRYCGKPIAFGVACPECYSLQNLQVIAAQQKGDAATNGAMRFIGGEHTDN